VPYKTDTDLVSEIGNIGLYGDANLRPTWWLSLRGGGRAELLSYTVLNNCAARVSPIPRPQTLPSTRAASPNRITGARAKPTSVRRHRASYCCRVPRSLSVRSETSRSQPATAGHSLDRSFLHHPGRGHAVCQYRCLRGRGRVRRSVGTQPSSRVRSSSRPWSTEISSSMRRRAKRPWRGHYAHWMGRGAAPDRIILRRVSQPDPGARHVQRQPSGGRVRARHVFRSDTAFFAPLPWHLRGKALRATLSAGCDLRGSAPASLRRGQRPNLHHRRISNPVVVHYELRLSSTNCSTPSTGWANTTTPRISTASRSRPWSRARVHRWCAARGILTLGINFGGS